MTGRDQLLQLIQIYLCVVQSSRKIPGTNLPSSRCSIDQLLHYLHTWYWLFIWHACCWYTSSKRYSVFLSIQRSQDCCSCRTDVFFSATFTDIFLDFRTCRRDSIVGSCANSVQANRDDAVLYITDDATQWQHNIIIIIIIIIIMFLLLLLFISDSEYL